METIFTIKDPRGFTVECDSNCWNRHILAKRPWMAGWEDRVIATISNPIYGLIFEDSHFKDRNVYYRKQPDYGTYLKVVVRYSEDGKGTVVTAHPVDSMKQGEKWVWPTSNA